jgi:hypothetical protein
MKDPLIIKEENAFYINSTKDGEIFFHIDGYGHIVITHTYVKPEFRGYGYGQLLMEAVLSMAEAEHRLVVPICSYAVHFMNHTDKYKHLLAQ